MGNEFWTIFNKNNRLGVRVRIQNNKLKKKLLINIAQKIYNYGQSYFIFQFNIKINREIDWPTDAQLWT